MNSIESIQQQLHAEQIDGWLLYDFRGQNPIALHVAGLESSGTRRWFLWIPAAGAPKWLIHVIEANTFVDVAPQMAGEMDTYMGWQDLDGALRKLVQAEPGMRIAMEYSPNNAIPYVSKVDAGTKELVEAATGAEIVSSADLVQQVQAVLSADQLQSHRHAAVACLTAKELAFDFMRTALKTGRTISEYDVQTVIMEHFAANGFGVDHPAIVAVNANATDPHYAPTANRHQSIEQGDMVLMDIFARATDSPLSCFGDITWTCYCGSETPAIVQTVFDVAAAGRDAAVALIQARLDVGHAVYGYEVDDACRQVIVDAGYGQYILHRTGHSLGPAVHFNGVNIDNLETQDRRRLIPGVLFTVEPGIYMPELNFGPESRATGLGIRTEINCFMHADRVEVTTLPLQTEVTALLA